MTPEIEESFNAFNHGKIPHSWMYDSLGQERSWIASSSALWLREFGQRYNQLNAWSRSERLGSYWLGGMFNPKGFLYTLKHEDFKRKKIDSVTLDKYLLNLEVMSQQWTEVDKFDYKVPQVKTD